ncbi:hypothetical protein FRC07_009337, partial [Ceratobasidium sp. 392]
MLHEHTHTTRNPPSSPGPPLPTGSSTSSDSGSGRYEPGLILYPYRRGSSASISSLSLIPVWRGLGSGVKRSGRIFVETKASKIKVSVADISKPLSSTSSLDPPEMSFGIIEEGVKDKDKARLEAENPEPAGVQTEVVAHSDQEPASTIVAYNLEATIVPPSTTETPSSYPTSKTAAHSALSDTPVDGLIVDDQVPLSGEFSHPRSNNSIIKVLKTGPKKPSAMQPFPIFGRHISRLHVLKQTFATIGRSLPVKPLRLPEKVKETSKETCAFMLEGGRSSVVQSGQGKLPEYKAGASQSDLVPANVRQPGGITPSNASLGSSILDDTDSPGGSSPTIPKDPGVGDLSSSPSELTIRPLFRGDVTRDSFIIDGESSLVNEPVNTGRDSSVNFITSSDNGRNAMLSVPIFKQRPSSGEYNRKNVFRRMSALVQAPAFKPLGLKK